MHRSAVLPLAVLLVLASPAVACANGFNALDVAFWVGANSLIVGVGTAFTHLLLAQYRTPPAFGLLIPLGAVVLGAIAGVGALVLSRLARLIQERGASDRGSDAGGAS